jgi:hypothetical protein
MQDEWLEPVCELPARCGEAVFSHFSRFAEDTEEVFHEQNKRRGQGSRQ